MCQFLFSIVISTLEQVRVLIKLMSGLSRKVHVHLYACGPSLFSFASFHELPNYTAIAAEKKNYNIPDHEEAVSLYEHSSNIRSDLIEKHK